MKWSVIYVFMFVSVVACNEPTDDQCPPASASSAGVVAEDSVCLGAWQWAHTYKWISQVGGNDWILSDTIYPGDPIDGFTTVSQYSVTIESACIRISANGETIAYGCYDEWESHLRYNIGLNNDTAVVASFSWLPESGHQNLSWGVYVSGAQATDRSLYTTMPYNTTQTGTATFEDDTGIRYRNVFMRME
jgi:hypothetical protein